MKILAGLFVLLSPCLVTAASVATNDDVETYVNIRSAPDAAADVVGRLYRGSPLPLVGGVQGWHEVEVGGGVTGFVSADWSAVLAEEVMEVEAESVASGDESIDDKAAATAPAEIDAAADAATDIMDAQQSTTAVLSPESAPQGTSGPPGPPGPPGAATIDGDPGFLVRFRESTEGENSQVFDNGNQVGIGTTTPAQRLEVNGSIQIRDQASNVAGIMITQASGDTGYIMHNRASTLTIGAGSVDRITIDRDGNVGIGVSRPAHPVEVANGAYLSAGGVWTDSSSRQLKENIAELSAGVALDVLRQLQPVQYNYRNDTTDTHLGFIAEDVPELVATPDRRGLSPMDIVAVLTKVVQAQQRRIELLESRLEERR